MTSKMAQGRKIVLIPSLQVFQFSVVKHASHVFFHLLQHKGKKNQTRLVKTKRCIVSEKLIFENSPALHKGVLYSCRAVAVPIPVSVTMKAQVGTPAGSYVTLAKKNTRESLKFNTMEAEFQEKVK